MELVRIYTSAHWHDVANLDVACTKLQACWGTSVQKQITRELFLPHIVRSISNTIVHSYYLGNVLSSTFTERYVNF